MKKLMLALVLAALASLTVLNVAAQDTIRAEDFSICNTMDIVVPVWFYNETSTIDAVGFQLSFDDSMIAYASIAATDATSGWTFNGSATGGNLTVTGSGTAVSQYTEDVLCNISFTCVSCATGYSSALSFSSLTQDLTGYTSTDGSVTWYNGCGISISDEVGFLDPVDITISVEYTNTVEDFILHVGFDPTMLEFVSGAPTGLTADWALLTAFEPAGSPGTVMIVGTTEYMGTPLLPGSTGDIVTLTFNVTCDSCDNNDSSAITVDQMEGDLAHYLTTDGSFTYQSGTGQPQLFVEGVFGAVHGHLATTVIKFNNSPVDVDAFGFDLTFCPDMMNSITVSPGPLTAGFESFDWNESSPGVLTIGGFDPDPADAIPAGSTGIIAIIDCVANEAGGYTCDLVPSNLTDDIEGWTTFSGIFSIMYPWIPSMSSIGLVLTLIGFSVGIFLRKRH